MLYSSYDILNSLWHYCDVCTVTSLAGSPNTVRTRMALCIYLVHLVLVLISVCFGFCLAKYVQYKDIALFFHIQVVSLEKTFAGVV